MVPQSHRGTYAAPCHPGNVHCGHLASQEYAVIVTILIGEIENNNGNRISNSSRNSNSNNTSIHSCNNTNYKTGKNNKVSITIITFLIFRGHFWPARAVPDAGGETSLRTTLVQGKTQFWNCWSDFCSRCGRRWRSRSWRWLKSMGRPEDCETLVHRVSTPNVSEHAVPRRRNTLRTGLGLVESWGKNLLVLLLLLFYLLLLRAAATAADPAKGRLQHTSKSRCPPGSRQYSL